MYSAIYTKWEGKEGGEKKMVASVTQSKLLNLPGKKKKKMEESLHSRWPLIHKRAFVVAESGKRVW